MDLYGDLPPPSQEKKSNQTNNETSIKFTLDIQNTDIAEFKSKQSERASIPTESHTRVTSTTDGSRGVVHLSPDDAEQYDENGQKNKSILENATFLIKTAATSDETKRKHPSNSTVIRSMQPQGELQKKKKSASKSTDIIPKSSNSMLAQSVRLKKKQAKQESSAKKSTKLHQNALTTSPNHPDNFHATPSLFIPNDHSTKSAAVSLNFDDEYDPFHPNIYQDSSPHFENNSIQQQSSRKYQYFRYDYTQNLSPGSSPTSSPV